MAYKCAERSDLCSDGSICSCAGGVREWNTRGRTKSGRSRELDLHPAIVESSKARLNVAEVTEISRTHPVRKSMEYSDLVFTCNRTLKDLIFTWQDEILSGSYLKKLDVF